jgi:hypothetical protein
MIASSSAQPGANFRVTVPIPAEFLDILPLLNGFLVMLFFS